MSTLERRRYPTPGMLAASVRDKSYQDCPLGIHVAAYLQWKQDEQRAAPTTIRDYEIPLAYLCLDHADLTLAALEPPAGRKLVRLFLARHWGAGAPAYRNARAGARSARTWSKNLSILSDFFNHCVAEDLMRGNPTIGIARPKKDDGRKRRVYAVDEPQRIIDACLLERDRCAVALVCEFGLRKSEIAGVRLSDYDMGRHQLTVTGKGDKTRPLPVVNPQLVQMLGAHWLDRRLSDTYDPDEYLLYPSGWGPRADPDGPSKGVNWTAPMRPLRPTAMHRWWKARLAAAGVPLTRKMHEMRHTAATDLLRSSGNLALVQQMLGHADIRTTAMYAHLDTNDLAEALQLLAEKRAAENEA